MHFGSRGEGRGALYVSLGARVTGLTVVLAECAASRRQHSPRTSAI